MNEEQYPRLYTGCPVEVFNDPSESDRTFGMVLRVKTRSADIVGIWETGMGILLDCWHADDPRIQTASEDVWEDATKGIFRLTEGEIQRRAMLQRMDTFEALLAKLALEIEQIKNPPEDGLADKPKRGRRRRTLAETDEAKYDEAVAARTALV